MRNTEKLIFHPGLAHNNIVRKKVSDYRMRRPRLSVMHDGRRDARCRCSDGHVMVRHAASARRSPSVPSCIGEASKRRPSSHDHPRRTDGRDDRHASPLGRDRRGGVSHRRPNSDGRRTSTSGHVCGTERRVSRNEDDDSPSGRTAVTIFHKHRL